MKKIGTAMENFAFKAFDFSGRASLLEYWLMMPLVWAIILFLAWGDLVEFWSFLLRRQVPPLNPLYWDAIVVFALTLIPRMSLTVRRLHDSGKSGRWVKLPIITVVSGLFLGLGLFAALATSNVVSGNVSQGLSVFAIVTAIAVGSADSAWGMVFNAAAVLNATGWDAIIGMLAELTASDPDNNISRGVALSIRDAQETPAVVPMLLQLVLIVATPFVAGFLHLFFMTSPSKPDHELDNSGLISGASLRRQGAVSDNPFAGYKYLYDRSPEEEAAHKAAAKEEIRSLYQQRVLGRS